MMKIARIASIALCMLLLVLPSLAMPFFPSEDSGAENRLLADYPVLLTDEGGLNRAFDSDFEDWLRDRFAFRAQAVRANAALNYRLLRSSVNDSVVVGAGDWLYYADTVPDYTGEGRLSEDELAAISENLTALADALAAWGAELYVAVIPNKNTVYPQYMPERYAMRRDEGNIPLLREVCEGAPVTWIDLVTPLREAAEGEPLVYYKTDTHWNALGAAIAAEAVLTAMGREATGYTLAGEADFSDGDLARLMGLPGALTERAPNVIPDVPLPQADFSQHRMSCDGSGEGRLLVYRDSFGTAVAPWLAQAYGQTELRWEAPLDGSRPCDDALLLLCERNLRMYLLEPPYIESIEPDEGDEESTEVIDEESFTEIDGDDDFFSDDLGDDSFGEIDGDDDFFSDDLDEDSFVEIDGDDDFFSDDLDEDSFVEIDEDDDFFSDDTDDAEGRA